MKFYTKKYLFNIVIMLGFSVVSSQHVYAIGEDEEPSRVSSLPISIPVSPASVSLSGSPSSSGNSPSNLSPMNISDSFANQLQSVTLLRTGISVRKISNSLNLESLAPELDSPCAITEYWTPHSNSYTVEYFTPEGLKRQKSL